MELFNLAQAELLRSNADRRHPFLYFTLATFGRYPEARTVVNRHVNAGLSVLLFTDRRTSKVSQARESPRVTALFYHPKKKLQVRMNGRAVLIDEGHEEYAQLLERVKSAGNLKDYTTRQAPGSPIAGKPDIEYGEDIHFLAIRIQPEYIDVLQLGREAHRRSGYTLRDGQWEEAVLVP
ncbi:MAG: pyridoxamine 5'-phosphate oxidase family protein [Phaeodactylibacter sp.]|nr:pyridoxamine 5'-phosphate oxidase family protein [Phaeodactylibacter sp.]MCB9297179.1 pyridoxamine 5'-phosphate oxidase family protein [Lewinellaceae bacterium]